MTIHRGDCGHIKSHWDNYKKCISCSHYSRESSGSTCSSWSNSVWDLAENRRTYSSRKKAMSTRKKSQNPSVSSDERKKKHGSTGPHGVTGRGKTHIGGNSLGTCTQGSTSPPATGQRSPGIPRLTHWQWTRRHIWHARHRPPGIHRPPGKWARKRLLACQSPGTNHPVTGHWN